MEEAKRPLSKILSLATDQRTKKNRIGEKKDQKAEKKYQRRPTRQQAEVLRRKNYA